MRILHLDYFMLTPSQSSGVSRIILAMTGASGIDYALTLLQALTQNPKVQPHLIVSQSATTVMKLETGKSLQNIQVEGLQVHDCHDLAAPPASGSWSHQGMVVCPCSMASLATINHGSGYNLIHRAADVTIKEKRPLILVPRETPLSPIHLGNMLGLAQAGATILPACPGFYHGPKTIQDLINQLVGRILDQLGLTHSLSPRWGEES
ncbi:MAG: UbiX family flavin prenyltransferase [Desulfovermiculus sp.]|nr:UbiX family flavin prenyltransferase [Desulfovermiculus sp.]